MSALLALLQAEVRRLVRTPQVYLYVVLPALLLLPCGVFIGVVLLSLSGPGQTVALPLELPAGLDLAGATQDAGLHPLTTPRPQASWMDGEADAAVVRVLPGDGIASAAPGVEPASRPRYIVEILATDDEVEKQLRVAVKAAGDHAMEGLVSAAGGDPDRDLWLAELSDVPVPEAPGPFPLDRGVRAYAVFALSLVGFFFLALTGVADRQEGVTETLLATPLRATTLLASRLLAVVGLQALAALLLAANLVLLLNEASRELPLPPATPAMVLALLGGTALCDALYLAIGTWAPSAKAANNAAGGAMFLILGALGLGTMAEVPAWLPLAGLPAADTTQKYAQAGLACLALTAVVVGLTGRALDRRVRLKLSPERR